MKTHTWKTLGGMMAFILAIMLTLTACGTAQMEEKADDAEMMDKPTIIFADLSWDSAQIQKRGSAVYP